jgi:hypothetical protein
MIPKMRKGEINKMKSKMVALFATLMIALMLVGVSYGLWSKILTIEGYVETGYVDAEFTGAFTDDDGIVDDVLNDKDDTGLDPAASGVDPKGRYEQDVGCSEAYFDPETAYVNIYNSYPSYYTTAWFDIKNTGTIPVKIQSVRISDGTTWWTVIPSEVNVFDLDGDGKCDVSIHVTEITLGQKIEKESTARMDLDIHVLEDAPQDSYLELYFTVEILLVQWNEYVP